jgi:galactose-1-phosphate uridylyltransferase
MFPRALTNTAYQLGTDRVNDDMMTEGVREQIARTLREFGFTPKGCARVYQKPYP